MKMPFDKKKRCFKVSVLEKNEDEIIIKKIIQFLINDLVLKFTRA